MMRDRVTAVAYAAPGIAALALGETAETAAGELRQRLRRAYDTWKANERQAAPFVYLALVAVAEFLTAMINPRVGLALHGGIVLALLFHGARRPDEASRRLLWTLLVAPLIRIMSLSLPLSAFPLVSWYFIISVPLAATAVLLARILRFSRSELGLTMSWRNLPADLLIIAVGVPLGFAEYGILRPDALVSLQGWAQPAIAAFILIVSTGYNEEFIFRGIMQSAAFPVIGRWALLYVNLMFAALHLGYQSATDLVFVFAVGMLFSWYRLRSGSIFAVTFCHGVVNITLFLIAPYLLAEPTTFILP